MKIHSSPLGPVNVCVYFVIKAFAVVQAVPQTHLVGFTFLSVMYVYNILVDFWMYVSTLFITMWCTSPTSTVILCILTAFELDSILCSHGFVYILQLCSAPMNRLQKTIDLLYAWHTEWNRVDSLALSRHLTIQEKIWLEKISRRLPNQMGCNAFKSEIFQLLHQFPVVINYCWFLLEEPRFSETNELPLWRDRVVKERWNNLVICYWVL